MSSWLFLILLFNNNPIKHSKNVEIPTVIKSKVQEENLKASGNPKNNESKLVKIAWIHMLFSVNEQVFSFPLFVNTSKIIFKAMKEKMIKIMCLECFCNGSSREEPPK